jgi:hypothetical protein
LRKSLIQIIEKIPDVSFFNAFFAHLSRTKRRTPSCKRARQPYCLFAAKIFDHITASVKRGAVSDLN